MRSKLPVIVVTNKSCALPIAYFPPLGYLKATAVVVVVMAIIIITSQRQPWKSWDTFAIISLPWCDDDVLEDMDMDIAAATTTTTTRRAMVTTRMLPPCTIAQLSIAPIWPVVNREEEKKELGIRERKTRKRLKFNCHPQHYSIATTRFICSFRWLGPWDGELVMSLPLNQPKRTWMSIIPSLWPWGNVTKMSFNEYGMPVKREKRRPRNHTTTPKSQKLWT
mmetsp:Transcript_11310/g.27236  ORF Transcript_11310/g.27236 Transcript_11310/m.27236 type:complete len:222 (-) Transcript_11310:87-752(-)